MLGWHAVPTLPDATRTSIVGLISFVRCAANGRDAVAPLPDAVKMGEPWTGKWAGPLSLSSNHSDICLLTAWRHVPLTGSGRGGRVLRSPLA